METPFKFLEAYEKGDRQLFFGRDEEIEMLYNLVRRSNLVVIYGKSGVGKTSIIRCGLVNEFDESEVVMIEIRRRGNIIESLKVRLTAVPNVKSNAADDVAGMVQKIYNRYLRPVYLFFDQFEELFILGDGTEKNDFLFTLKKIRQLEIPCVIVLIIREEYLGELTDFKQEAPFLFDHTLQIRQMDQPKSIKVVNDLFDKLTEDTYIVKNEQQERVNIEYDKELTPHIIDIVTNGKFFIELPYLQVYLDKLYKIAYEKANGKLVFDKQLLEDTRVNNIETVIDNLLDEQIKKATEKINESSDAKVISLLKIFITEQDTKKPVSFGLIQDKATERGLTEEQIAACLDIFTNALLIRPLEGNQYELSHDSVAAKIGLKRATQKRTQPVLAGNPYKGLAAFTESEQDVKRFFGRGESIEKVLALIESRKLVVISGASGTGKSSLIKAGIFPELKRRGYEIFENFRPGDYPLITLDRAITNMQSKTSQKLRYLLLIDQYEELITRAKREEDAELFKQKLLALIETPNTILPNFSTTQSLTIVITVRADFEPQFKAGALEKYWDKGRYVVPYLNTRELEQVIENPAELAACYFEPVTLIRNIAEEVSGRPSALPLLSFALSLMYEASLPSRIITQEIYNDIGVFGALQKKAETIYYSFDDASRLTMQAALLRMVSFEGSELASRRVYLKELMYETDEENKRVMNVLTILENERLVIQQQDENGMMYVEPAHDALLKGWTKLWEWIKDFGKENILFRERLDAAIMEWEAKDKATSGLWSDDKRIFDIKELAISKNSWFNKNELDFSRASLQEWETLKKQEGSRKRTITYAIISTGILFLALGIWGILNSVRATKNAKLATKNEAAAILQRDSAVSSKRLADSSLQIAEIKSDEAISSKLLADSLRSQAEYNLQTVSIEQQKTLDALNQVKKEQIKVELARRTAVQNELLANLRAKELGLARDSIMGSYRKSVLAEEMANRKRDSIKVLADSLDRKSQELVSSIQQLKQTYHLLDITQVALNAKNDTIKTLNISTVYEAQSSNNRLIKGYQDGLSNQTDYSALWPPSYQLKIGDIGKFDANGEFKVLSSLSSFNIPFSHHKAAKPFKVDIIQGDIQIHYNYDSCRMKFPGNSFLFKTGISTIQEMDDIPLITNSINTLSKKGNWDPNWLVVTELVETDSAVVIVPSEKGGELLLAYKSTPGYEALTLPANFTIIENKTVPVILNGRLTPLFKVIGLRKASRKS